MAVREVAKGVYRIPLAWSNVYVLAEGREAVLIDAGLKAGGDLRVADSGEKRGKRTVSKRGDAELRRLLSLAAQSNLRCQSSPFKYQYQRERAKGLSSTAALVAVAWKLAKVCWSLHKHGATYEESRVTVEGKSTRNTESTQILASALDKQP